VLLGSTSRSFPSLDSPKVIISYSRRSRGAEVTPRQCGLCNSRVIVTLSGLTLRGAFGVSSDLVSAEERVRTIDLRRYCFSLSLFFLLFEANGARGGILIFSGARKLPSPSRRFAAALFSRTTEVRADQVFRSDAEISPSRFLDFHRGLWLRISVSARSDRIRSYALVTYAKMT